MGSEPGNAMMGQPGQMARARPEEPEARHVTKTTTLLLGVWIGLLAGFLDVGLLVISRRWIERDFYRLGGDFAWLIPAGVTGLVLAPALILVLVAVVRRSPVRSGTAMGVLSFVGFLDVSARLPLELWAILLLSGGLATQMARLLGRRGRAISGSCAGRSRSWAWSCWRSWRQPWVFAPGPSVR